MIGIIGGTGLYDLIKQPKQRLIKTPFGKPSDKLFFGKVGKRNVCFLPRHGKDHTIPPHRINWRANIWALKKAGCERIIAICACGSLQPKYKPGDFVIPDQFIDFGKSVHTFYDNKVCHVSMANPFCPDIRDILYSCSKKLNFKVHKKATYLRIEGPQLSTKAASRMYRNFGHIIGMTGVPEAILARELGICFGILAYVTDYDAWFGKAASFEQIKSTASMGLEKIKKIMELAMKNMEIRRCSCADALKGAT